MTPRERRILALYHWHGDFISAINERREVWLIETHRPCRSTQEKLHD